MFQLKFKKERRIKGIYLDELEPSMGRMENEIMQKCGIMCYLNLD